jgi:hypothetical protein
VRCGDKNKVQRVRYLEGGGNAIFINTAPKLDRKFEKGSKEYEFVQKCSPDDKQN